MKPVLINAGRGGSQVEADIISCLEDGTLGGVSLDVFEHEPLAAGSPLWSFKNAILTPHVAAESSIPALASYVANQIARHESRISLNNIVDVYRGY
jgi:glyoxylate/hydroxypyruvate reductase A